MKEVKRKRKEKKTAGEKISLSLKKYFSNPKAKKKLSELIKKRYSNPTAREKLAASLRKYYSDHPEMKKKISTRNKKYWKEHPEMVKRLAELSQKFRSTPAFRKKMSGFKKKQYKENQELIKKIDKTMTRWWHEHPNIRKERSIAAKKLFIKNPERFKKFLKYGNNPAALSFRTRQGFIVRSRGEQTIANFLHNNKMPSSYESKTLIFKKEGQICVPDFWLPKFKIYIEYYGGYPKAWKKKVLKNRLYKKYKIPCIFITPAELRNLNYYLVKELKR